MTSLKPEISVIVPVLNEAPELPGLLDCLAGQTGIAFEVIICDGGSGDGSQEIARQWMENGSLSISAVNSPRGRGCQMNAGAERAAADLLLFLHADSRFSGTKALCTAVDACRQELESPEEPVAARFGLRFRRQNDIPSLAYFFYEAKARLNRGECIRGDQGFMISRAAFNRIGGFDASLPFLEDVRLALAVAATGRWLLLPAEITTSARRFETEGLHDRQVINAIIINAIQTGWNDLFTDLPGLYRCSQDSGRINLVTFLAGIRRLLADKPDDWLAAFWQGTGRHIAGNAWQLFFWLDVRRSFRKKLNPADVKPVWLRFYEQWLSLLFHSRFAGRLARMAVRIWFRYKLRGTSRTA